MGDSIVVWLTIAVLLFWAMGAYNRLMRLRSTAIAAFLALEVLFNQYLLLVQSNFYDGCERESREGFDASTVACATLVGAAQQFNASLKVAHAHPLNGATTSALRTALETLCLSWSRLQELPSDLAGPALPNNLQAQWEHVYMQVAVCSVEFNRTVANYNEAIHQFPAILLAWLFGFKPAQPI